MTSRVGPFEVVRELAQAPGSLLVEAVDADGERRLLQLARFRAVSNEDERTARQEEERALARRTAELISDRDYVVHAHGGADDSAGERVLFWALPYCEHREPISLSAHTLDEATLVSFGLRLAERLVLRHQRGVFDPSLSEHTIGFDGKDRVDFLNVPLFIEKGWVSPSMESYRVAPGENGVATEQGDLWRLGCLLANLATQVDGLSDDTLTLFNRFRSEESAARPESAEAARAALATHGRVLSKIKEAEAVRDHAAADARILTSTSDVLKPEVLGDQEDVAEPLDPLAQRNSDAEVAAPATGEIDLSDDLDDGDDGDDGDGVEDGPSEEATFDDEETFDDSTFSDETTDDEASPTYGPTDREEAKSPSSDFMLLSMTVPPGRSDSGAFASEAITTQLEPETPIPVPEIAESSIPPPNLAVEPLAAAWHQPVLPSGESPWSEVFTTRGVHHRAQPDGEFPGFDGELPRPLSTGPAPAAPPATPAPSPLVDSDIDEELAMAISGFSAKKAVTVVLGALVFLGLMALLSRLGGNGEPIDQTVRIPATNQFVLESDPPGASVYAEADGSALGKTPITFLMPGDVSEAVLLVAPGHEPIRAVLSERGQIRVRLSPMDAKPCTVRLISEPGVKLSGIGFDLGQTREVTIEGAALVRGQREQRGAGAQLVRCPDLGGPQTRKLTFSMPPRTRSVHIIQPASTSAYLNGDPVGRVPARAVSKGAFAHVRVDGADGMSEERWIPTSHDVEVSMPEPKPRRLPVLVVPDGADEDDEVEVSAPDSVAPLGANPQEAGRGRQLLDRGLMRLRAGDAKEAKNLLIECVELDDRFAPCHRWLGTAYVRLRNPQKAGHHYQRYLDLAPTGADAETVRQELLQNAAH